MERNPFNWQPSIQESKAKEKEEKKRSDAVGITALVGESTGNCI